MIYLEQIADGVAAGEVVGNGNSSFESDRRQFLMDQYQKQGNRSVSFYDHVSPYLHAAGKLLCAWGLIVYGAVTFQHVVMGLGGIFSALQIYVLWRDKIRDYKK